MARSKEIVLRVRCMCTKKTVRVTYREDGNGPYVVGAHADCDARVVSAVGRDKTRCDQLIHDIYAASRGRMVYGGRKTGRFPKKIAKLMTAVRGRARVLARNRRIRSGSDSDFKACWCKGLEDYLAAEYSVAEYRKSRSRWAGGDHCVSVSVHRGTGPVDCSGCADRVWSGNGKWSGNDSVHRFRLSEIAALRVKRYGIPVVDGHAIMDAVVECPLLRRSKNCFFLRVRYAKQGRGFDIYPADGWVVKEDGGASLFLSRHKAIEAWKESV